MNFFQKYFWQIVTTIFAFGALSAQVAAVKNLPEKVTILQQEMQWQRQEIRELKDIIRDLQYDRRR